ncbi:hypothetical protein MMC25_003236 [Agyrium rufum]|nr:hypothetical protein [Agyrium rufum]
MASTKRKRTDAQESAAKKPRKGFAIGPANLPDGVHRRKVQKIKKNLIQKAKLKQSYAKLKEREGDGARSRPSYYDREDEEEGSRDTEQPQSSGGDERGLQAKKPSQKKKKLILSRPALEPEPEPEPASLDLHPARQERLDRSESPSAPLPHPSQTNRNSKKQRHPPPHQSDAQNPNHTPTSKTRASRPSKPQPFLKAEQHSQKLQAERQARHIAIEKALAEKQVRLEERERFRRKMAKARTGGRNGQRKLGLESSVLLEKIRRDLGREGG